MLLCTCTHEVMTSSLFVWVSVCESGAQVDGDTPVVLDNMGDPRHGWVLGCVTHVLVIHVPVYMGGGKHGSCVKLLGHKLPKIIIRRTSHEWGVSSVSVTLAVMPHATLHATLHGGTHAWLGHTRGLHTLYALWYACSHGHGDIAWHCGGWGHTVRGDVGHGVRRHASLRGHACS